MLLLLLTMKLLWVISKSILVMLTLGAMYLSFRLAKTYGAQI